MLVIPWFSLPVEIVLLLRLPDAPPLASKRGRVARHYGLHFWSNVAVNDGQIEGWLSSNDHEDGLWKQQEMLLLVTTQQYGFKFLSMNGPTIVSPWTITSAFRSSLNVEPIVMATTSHKRIKQTFMMKNQPKLWVHKVARWWARKGGSSYKLRYTVWNAALNHTASQHWWIFILVCSFGILHCSEVVSGSFSVTNLHIKVKS